MLGAVFVIDIRSGMAARLAALGGTGEGARPHRSKSRSTPSHYSVRNAFMGSMLAARRAGMNPAIAANTASTMIAPASVTGS